MKKFKGVPVIKNRRMKKLIILAVATVILLGAIGVTGYTYLYRQNLKPVTQDSQAAEVVFTIEPGTPVRFIASSLEKQNLIRAGWAFEHYVRTKGLNDDLKAGTYRLKPSQSVATIASILSEGKVAVDLFTVFPAQRIDQIRQALIDKGGFSATEVDEALKPSQYKGHPALEDKPEASSLEGYLYPDSYQKIAQTKPVDIIRSALDEMAKALSKEVRAGIISQGITIHEGVILASIVEKEIPANPLKVTEDRQKAAQVFLKRKKIGMQLGSDVTACYGATIAGVMKTGDNCDNFVGYDSPYNTRIHSGMPPGPISNVSRSSLLAIAEPANTDYLFFVAGADCVTRFSNTNDEHEALVAKHGLSTQSNSCN